MYEPVGELDMAAIETLAQRAKRELARQLDEELQGAFPASDTPKVTRSSTKSGGIADRSRRSAIASKNEN
jgi:hypothetical protein